MREVESGTAERRRQRAIWCPVAPLVGLPVRPTQRPPPPRCDHRARAAAAFNSSSYCPDEVSRGATAGEYPASRQARVCAPVSDKSGRCVSYNSATVNS